MYKILVYYEHTLHHTYVTGFKKRGHFAHFTNFGFKTLISGTIAAMNFKRGRIFFHHPTTLAANCWPRPLPVWAGRAAALIAFENRRFMPLFGGSPLGTEGLLRVLTDL